MPLLTSPIDGSPMRQIHRYGIEIDVCPTTGGIWLDKGELEKLMALLKEDADSQSGFNPQHQPQQHPQHQQDHRYNRSRDDDDYDDDRYERGYKKKGKMSRMMDIFDF